MGNIVSAILRKRFFTIYSQQCLKYSIDHIRTSLRNMHLEPETPFFRKAVDPLNGRFPSHQNNISDLVTSLQGSLVFKFKTFLVL